MTRNLILVVEDDPDIRTTVADILELEGYKVELAGNGAEAIATLQHNTPNLVILDMRMPVLDGWGFARRLHEMGMTLPILVMTAAQDASRWAQEIGAQGFIAKPFDLMDLISIVERHVSRA
jgi:CheY-like chemotaxis protein